ncbi:MAG: nucleotidyl transferase AbiEii/AbiGii toxin family protein [Gemmatimonadaceae bacterium]
MPPPNHRELQDAVNRYAEYHSLAPNRVQRWVAFMVLGGALSRLQAEDHGPAFLVKGGVSLELRLRLKARATKDYDTVFRGERAKLLDALDDAFAAPYEGFTFRVTRPREMTHMTRFDIKVEYWGKTWSSIQMEVSSWEGTPLPPEEVPAISLADFGLTGPASLPCLPLTKQVAQKLHAMTETLPSGQPNERVRDLLDLWVLRELVPPSPALRRICEETFRIREQQPWPPEIVVPAHWVAPFTELARSLDLPTESAEAAAADVRSYVQRIVDATEADDRAQQAP